MKFYTVRQIAELLQTSEVTIRRWIRQERLPAIRIGRAYRISRKELEQLISKSYFSSEKPKDDEEKEIEED